MRILFITPTLSLGGSERLTVGYAAGLKQRGHEVAIAFGIKNRHSVATEKAGIPTYEVSRMLPTRETVREWVGNLRRLVHELEPDVIHAQSVATAAVARLAAPRTPMLVTMHGVPTDDEAAAAMALRATFAHVTAVSTATADGLHRFPWSPQIDVLHAGVDIAKLESDSVTFGPVELVGSPKLCCVARQMPQKGIDVLLRTLARLADELPEVGLTLVGDGDDLEQNKKLARALGLGDRTHFTGGVPNASPYMRAADAIVLSSRWEGLPVVVLEALALARPLVATAVNGTPTVCIDGETGWLVPPDDEESLAAAIVDCVTHPDEAERRAQAGRRLIEDGFTLEKMLDRLEALLIQCRSRRQRVPPTKPRVYYHAARGYDGLHRRAARRTPAGNSWSGVRILGYHRITSDAKDVYGIDPVTFRAQMKELAASDVKVVRLDRALDLLEQQVEGRFACVTFDDGYLDVLENGVPVLEELGIPATIFSIGDVLEGRIPFSWHRDETPAITVANLPRLLESGLVDVQAHSLTHPRLTMVSDAELRREVEVSKAMLERHLPYELTSFCYPAGIYTGREVEAVFAAGFRAGVTTRSGVNHDGESLGELRRTMIDWRDTVEDFRLKLSGRLDDTPWLAERLHARRTRGGTRRRTATSPA
jgi:glycosyltransferase involved in cell wall biosynthesis/peptidoglycan/xylan/chitin deacetylase (PgdA/CDA1 family)